MATARSAFFNVRTEMIKESYALMTGLFVLTLGTAMVIMGFLLGDYGRERDIYELTTQGAVSGLNPESEVIYRGVKAGKVTRIGFDPGNMRTILVRIELDKGLPITRGTFATLRVQPLTGIAQVELGDTAEDPAPLTTDPLHPARIVIKPSLMDKLTATGGDILNELTELTQRLNRLLDEGNQRQVRDILLMLGKAVSEFVALEQRIGTELNRLPAADQKLHAALAEHAAAARSVRETSERVGKLATSAEELLAGGKTMAHTLSAEHLPELQRLMRELRDAAADFRKLSSRVERDPQWLLRGQKPSMPGPGEPGFQEPR